MLSSEERPPMVWLGQRLALTWHGEMGAGQWFFLTIGVLEVSEAVDSF